MQTTIDIDEDILQAAEERARITGQSTGAVISAMARMALSLDEPVLPPLRDGLPQVRFDSAFVANSESILALLRRTEEGNDLGFPLIIPPATLESIERIASRWNISIGQAARGYVEESLLLQKKWPTRNGELVALSRPDGTPIITTEFVKYLQYETELKDFLD